TSADFIELQTPAITAEAGRSIRVGIREKLMRLSTVIDDYVRRVFRKAISVENLNYNNTSEEKARIRKYFSDLAKTVYPE
ncbi:hypothetical protein PMX75_25890, partial [Enterocloster clostridioformis]|nr:hypothetical protein [Enterocloster clostridioformis]